MPEAVIVATARTAIGRAKKGSFVDVRIDGLVGDVGPQRGLQRIAEGLVGLRVPQVAALGVRDEGDEVLCVLGGTDERSAEIALLAHREDLSLKEAALKLGYVTEEQFDQWVRPEDMTGPTSS